MYYFFALHNNHKSFHMSTVHLNRKCSKVVGISSDIFGNVRKSLENLRKSSEVAWTFLGQNSHAFDSEKVDRCTVTKFIQCSVCIQLWAPYYIYIIY